jgi:hypothetical protein
MTTINANTYPQGTTVSLGASLRYEDSSQPMPVTVQTMNNADWGNRFGGITYDIEPMYRPEPLPLSALSSTTISGILLEVDANKTTFGYKGYNQTGDGDIILFYDSSKNYLNAQFTTPTYNANNSRYEFNHSSSLPGNTKFILFGGRYSTIEIYEISLS